MGPCDATLLKECGMRLDHLDIHVLDVAKTRDFFVHHFGLRELETRGANGLSILTDDAGLELVISLPIAKFGGSDPVGSGVVTYHIGFTLNSRRDVDDVFERLNCEAGNAIMPPRNMRGLYLFYCTAPGGILVEVRTKQAD